MRNVLVGTVESTRAALLAMSRAGQSPAALVTLDPQRAGRHSDYVDLAPDAGRLGVPVRHVVNVNDPQTLADIRSIDPDHILVIGWSQICGNEFLTLARRGAIGYHPSALPLNRGRAVIPWTILQGCGETASTLFWLDEGMDSGDILLQEPVSVAPDETAATLYAKHVEALGRMLDRALPALAAGEAPRTPQDHSRATFCAKRTADDGMIDWTRPAREVWTLIRAVGAPYPGAFTFVNGARLNVWDAALVGTAPYVGLTGQVQAVTGEGALVRCGDGEHVRLTLVSRGDEVPVPAGVALKLHVKLGLGPLDNPNHLIGRVGR